MISIIDYGVGNFLAIKRMFERIGVSSEITTDKESIERSEKLILPGVGAFSYAMDQLNSMGLKELLDRKVLVDKVPVLGICLGAQLLFEFSQEGQKEGLGWIEGEIVKFDKDRMDKDLKVPNMGWNDVVTLKNSSLVEELSSDARFYFAHSYHMECKNQNDPLLSANYGYTYTSAIARDNIYGVQFHPEKSHKYGMKLLANFAGI